MPAGPSEAPAAAAGRDASRLESLSLSLRADAGHATHAIARSMFALHAGRDEYIDGDELRQLCNGMGRELSAREHADVMARLDTSGDGRVGFDEFLVGWDVGMSIEALLDENVAAHMREERTVAEAALALRRGEAAAAVTADPEAAELAAEERHHQENAHEREELHEAYHTPREETRAKLKDRPGRTRRLQLQQPSSTPTPAPLPPLPSTPRQGQPTVLDC